MPPLHTATCSIWVGLAVLEAPLAPIVKNELMCYCMLEQYQSLSKCLHASDFARTLLVPLSALCRCWPMRRVPIRRVPDSWRCVEGLLV